MASPGDRTSTEACAGGPDGCRAPGVCASPTGLGNEMCKHNEAIDVSPVTLAAAPGCSGARRRELASLLKSALLRVYTNTPPELDTELLPASHMQTLVYFCRDVPAP